VHNAARRSKEKKERTGTQLPRGSISVTELKELTARRLEVEKSNRDKLRPPALFAPPLPPPPPPQSAANGTICGRPGIILEPPTPDAPEVRFMKSPALLPVSPGQIVEDAGTPRSHPFAYRSKPRADSFQLDGAGPQSTIVEAPAPAPAPAPATRRGSGTKKGTKVVVYQEGNKTYTRIIKTGAKKKSGQSKRPPMGRQEGIVSKFMGNFGFLHAKGFAKYDVFFHMSEVEMNDRDGIDEKSVVEFTVVEDPWRSGQNKRPELKAVEVVLMDPATEED
jgi:cold shock CspA family protein